MNPDVPFRGPTSQRWISHSKHESGVWQEQLFSVPLVLLASSCVAFTASAGSRPVPSAPCPMVRASRSAQSTCRGALGDTGLLRDAQLAAEESLPQIGKAQTSWPFSQIWVSCEDVWMHFEGLESGDSYWLDCFWKSGIYQRKKNNQSSQILCLKYCTMFSVQFLAVQDPEGPS